MTTLQTTKNGGYALIFTKEQRQVALQIFDMVESGFTHTIEEPRQKLADIKKKVEKKAPVRLTLSIPSDKTTVAIPTKKGEIRHEVRTLIVELCAKDGLQYGVAWNKAYRLLFQFAGYDVRKATKTIVKGKPLLIDTVIDDGKGQDLIRALRNYLDK